jgi:hypothetical protein
LRKRIIITQPSTRTGSRKLNAYGVACGVETDAHATDLDPLDGDMGALKLDGDRPARTKPLSLFKLIDALLKLRFGRHVGALLIKIEDERSGRGDLCRSQPDRLWTKYYVSVDGLAIRRKGGTSRSSGNATVAPASAVISAAHRFHFFTLVAQLADFVSPIGPLLLLFGGHRARRVQGSLLAERDAAREHRCRDTGKCRRLLGGVLALRLDQGGYPVRQKLP